MAETIKEFLVSLGFKTDSSSINKFKSGIADATKAVAVLGAALVATNALVFGFVKNVAKTYESLGLLSKRINVSVKTIQEFGYVASLTGSSVEAANSSLENLSRVVGEAARGIGRGAATFKALGLSAKKQNGELKTTEEILTEISKKVKDVSVHEKTAILSKLGIDPSLVGALTEDVSELRDEFNKLYADVEIDSEKAGEASIAFMDSITRLSFVFNKLKESIALKFIPELKNGIDLLRRLMIDNSKKIIETISPILKSLLDLTQAFFILVRRVGEGAGKLIDVFKSINNATGGWAGYILAAVAAWKLLNIAFLASPIGRLILFGLTLALLIDDFLTFNEGGNAAINWGSTLNKVLLAIGVSLVALRVATLAVNAALALTPLGRVIAGITAISLAATVLIKNWQKVKDWFAPFFNWMYTGFEKIAGIVNGVVDAVKGTFGVDDTGDAKNARDNFAQSTRRLSSFGSIGSTPLTSGVSNSSVKQSINQDVKITVNGANSPEETGRIIYDEQSRINADLIRNSAGVVR